MIFINFYPTFCLQPFWPHSTFFVIFAVFAWCFYRLRTRLATNYKVKNLIRSAPNLSIPFNESHAHLPCIFSLQNPFVEPLPAGIWRKRTNKHSTETPSANKVAGSRVDSTWTYIPTCIMVVSIN